MGRKVKAAFEEKLKAVREYFEGKKSQKQLAREYNVSKTTINQWVSVYQGIGEEGLYTTSKNNGYSASIKLAAVKDYLNGIGSQLEICRKYKIRSKTQLQRWILKYNSHEEIKSSSTGGKPLMIKGRATTFEERVEIVKYCIEHGRDYNETAQKYNVSYQQIRNWTVKYDEYGIDGLIDRRGKRKSEDQMTEMDKLKAENKLLGAKNRRLEIENEFLKKLREIERG